MFLPACALLPWRMNLLVMTLLVGLTLISVGCTVTQATDQVAPVQWQAWHVIETKSGRLVPLPEWLKALESQEIVYVGEEHYNRHHVDAAVRLLSAFRADGVRPAIGMEMFAWDGQAALDGYLSHGIEQTQEFLEQAHWKTNWGGAFDNYEPLVRYAKEHHLPLYAMNPPKMLVRRVAKLGLSQARQGTEWAEWNMDQEDIVDDPAYRARLFEQLRRCHGGGADTDYQMMYEASMVRDEAMARTLVAAVKAFRKEPSASQRILMSYTGGGHIQYNLPIPARVSRRLTGDVRQVTIYLASFDSGRIAEIQELLQDHIADYVWLTPVGGQGPVQRCR